MKNIVLVCAFILILIASGCSGWTVQPTPFFAATPIPSHTPFIFSPTPNIVNAPTIVTATATSSTETQSSGTLTPSPEPPLTETTTGPTQTPTSTATKPADELKVDVLGCNTSIDITHGMGEVTNAYVTVSNIGTADLTNVCATLRGLDEGRPHPDKTKCLASLPTGNLVTFKLTVDTTFKKDTPIQIDVSADQIPLQRIPKDSCTDIGLFPPDVGELDIAKPIP